ncbi:MAG: S8 family serine peptidase, partial [Candidatus Cloacimonas sp.]
DVAAAIIYATDNGCNVINMSWGDPDYSSIIADACEYAYSKGVVLVASAGNDGTAGLSYPAKLSNVISVGSVNNAKQLSTFSSYGVDLDIVALGERVLSTYKLDQSEQYFRMDGTSMSAGFVSGAAALLLSLHPGLSPSEVRSIMLNSTDDLYSVGFDVKTGHGLLNVKKMLDNLDPPYLEITNPPDQLGISSSVPIIGSVYGSDFANYTLCYKKENDTNNSDWKDVTSHSADPILHFEQVHNGELANFYIPEYFPEGKYLLRLQYEKTLNNMNRYNYFRTVIVDRTAPVLRTETVSGFSRWTQQNLQYYISANFDEVVNACLKITASNGNIYNIYSTATDSIQIWKLPSYLPEGYINLQIEATNLANLSSVSNVFANFMNIHYVLISNYGYSKKIIGPPQKPLLHKRDYDNNGIDEYVSMEIAESGYGPVKVFEPHLGAHILKHNFNDSFWPLDIGSTYTTGSKNELLLLRVENAEMWLTPQGGNYPDNSADSLVIALDTGISGGVMADYDNDGKTEILLVKNLPNERVIQAYKRISTGALVQRNTISNPTTTFSRNNFVPTIIVENLDRDNYPDILCADTDGDVMIFEIINSSEYHLRWSTRMPVGNTYSLTTGDFNGDGNIDFFVAGYTTDTENQDLNFWFCRGFKNTGNNTYTSMGDIMFNEVSSLNSITCADIDKDGSAEIILALTPNLYVLKYINNQFSPVFYNQCFRNYQVSTWEDENGTVRILANVKTEADSVYMAEWSPVEPFTGPATPANLTVKPLNENSINVAWTSTGSPEYALYRKDDEGNTILLTVTGVTNYTDTGLQTGKVYQYAIASRDPSCPQVESILGPWMEGIPLPNPEVVQISFAGQKELRLLFNQAMPNDFINPSHYFVNAGMGNPVSANSISGNFGIQLRFRNSFPSIDSLFVIELRNLTGISGVEPIQMSYSFPYQEDVIPPEILSVNVLPSKQAILVTFSEEISPNPALHLANYILHCPQNDPANQIDTLAFSVDKVTITFTQRLQFSNYAYYLEINNLTDLAGNLILPQGNLARFGIQNINNLDHLNVFPNPVTPKHPQEAIFINFPVNKKGKIAIYSSSGQLVFKDELGPFIEGSNNITYTWNLKNNDQRPVSSGVYFYVVEMGGKFKRGKLAIIK